MPNLKRTVTRALVVSLCTLGLPIPAVQAELVATDRVEATRQDGRELLGSLFDRADVRAALERQGVSPDEAKARVNAMSDDEVERLAARFDSLLAGGLSMRSGRSCDGAQRWRQGDRTRNAAAASLSSRSAREPADRDARGGPSQRLCRDRARSEPLGSPS